MSKFRVLVGQVYKQKIRSKSFILMTLFYIVLVSVVLFWQDIRGLFESEATTYAVVNETDVDLQAGFLNTAGEKWNFVETLPEAELAEGKYAAAITLNATDGQLTAKITSQEALPLNEQQMISQTLLQASQLYAISQADLSAEAALAILQSEPVITTETLQVISGKSEQEKTAGILVSYFLGFLIYFFITTYLSMITTEVASEKGSRALEMLLVSVRPATHFRAKLVGIFTVALTQFTIIAVLLITLLRLTNNGEQWARLVELFTNLAPSYLLYTVLFLFASIFLYLIIGALFGSLVSKVEEAGQVMLPAMALSIAGFYVLLSGMVNPDTLLIKICSYIPFTSGMVMPLRIGATDLHGAEPLISLALLIGTVLVFYRLTLSFYRRSVLSYSSGGVIQKLVKMMRGTT